jgi:hypothetical protein
MVVRATSLPEWQAGGGLNQYPGRCSGTDTALAVVPLNGILLDVGSATLAGFNQQRRSKCEESQALAASS